MTKEILNKLGNQWLEEKNQRMKNLLKIALPEEALYREIMLSLGYPNNKVQFLELALLTPYTEIQKIKSQHLIEKVLLYRAGFLQDSSELPANIDKSLKFEKSFWSFKAIRPANFPDKRISDISHLLAQSTENGIYRYFRERIEKSCKKAATASPKKIVEEIMAFKGIGISRKREMFFNIILPFFIADESFIGCHNFLLNIFETHPPLDENSRVKRSIRELGVKVSNAKEYFGLVKYASSANL